jgi:hypothetical protein
MRAKLLLLYILIFVCSGAPTFAQAASEGLNPDAPNSTDAETAALNRATARFVDGLKKAEISIPPSFGTTTESKKDIAILTLQIEDLRHKYATMLQLQSEGITARNNVLSARLAYEKAQLQLAAKAKLVISTMSMIQKQRTIADSLQTEYRRGLAGRGSLQF